MLKLRLAMQLIVSTDKIWDSTRYETYSLFILSVLKLTDFFIDTTQLTIINTLIWKMSCIKVGDKIVNIIPHS